MRKIETIWHYLLQTALDEKKYRHTQQEIAHEFDYSLSTVHHALKTPEGIGAIRKTGKFFVLDDFTKLLYFWASTRNVQNDIIYKTYAAAAVVMQIESLVPPDSVYASYSAARHILGETPADYSKVYFYLSEERLGEAQTRFPPSPKEPNVFVLRLHPKLIPAEHVATLPLTFVDIWNLPDWYAKDFTRALEEKMHGILS